MVKKCSTCVKHGRVCKVHVRSGKCSECLRRGQRCDIRVTESEFKRLAAQKEKLRAQIKESRVAQDAAMKAHEKVFEDLRIAREKALEDLQVARAREERLRREMDLIDRRAEEAIAVEEKNIEEEENETMGVEALSDEVTMGPSLGPHTWSALEGLPEDFWDLVPPLPIAPLPTGGPS